MGCMLMKPRKERNRNVSFRDIAPNMVTSGNLMCGMFSLILVMRGLYVPAAWMIAMAVFFDFMDGRVARSLGAGSAFGLEYDSLADVVSFGVAPAILMYSAYLRDFFGVAGALVAAFFALCGALRLARFNIVHVPGPFQGLPIPAGGLFLASMVIGGISIPSLVMAVLVVFAGSLMISNVPYGNLKGMRKASHKRVAIFYGTCFAIIWGFHSRSILVGMVIYIFSGFLHIDWKNFFSQHEEDDSDLKEEL